MTHVGKVSTVSFLLFWNVRVFNSVFNVKSEVTSNTKEQRLFPNQKEGPRLMHLPSLAKVDFFDKKTVHFINSKKSWLVNHKEGQSQGRTPLDAEEIDIN